jgi:aquaporin Z
LEINFLPFYILPFLLPFIRMQFLPLLAESVGAFLLLTSILFTGNWLVIGLTLAGVVYLTGNISGGHINPAVSIAMYLKGAINASECVGYSLSQILGAVAALCVFKQVA